MTVIYRRLVLFLDSVCLVSYAFACCFHGYILCDAWLVWIVHCLFDWLYEFVFLIGCMNAFCCCLLTIGLHVLLVQDKRLKLKVERRQKRRQQNAADEVSIEDNNICICSIPHNATTLYFCCNLILQCWNFLLNPSVLYSYVFIVLFEQIKWMDGNFAPF